MLPIQTLIQRTLVAGQELVDEVDTDFDQTDGWEWFDMGPFLANERDDLEELRRDRLFDPWDHYNCNDPSVWTMPRPLYSLDMWMRLRQAYIDVVGSTKSSIGNEASPEDGFAISAEVKQAPGKGRGLFAAEDIPRGQLIWTALKQSAAIDSGEDYKHFLDLLQVDEACDVIQWSYVDTTPRGADAAATHISTISTDLDNMTFVNGDEEDANAGCLPQWEARDPGGCLMNDYALQDIKKGEEILVDYGEFAIRDGWRQFGLLNENKMPEDRLFVPWDHYNCDDASVWTMPRPLYTQDMWMLLRQAYVDIVGGTNSNIGTKVSAEDGFVMSTEVKQAPGKGRGLFAAEEIPRGQLIWSSSKQTASFETGKDYKHFLDSLEVDAACDVIQWSYVHAVPGGVNGDDTHISTDLDNMTFVNGDVDDANAGCLPEWEVRHPGGCLENVYALQDVKKGEEILVDYGEFAIKDGWGKFGIQ
jgi:hypothetical protein